VMGIRKDSDLSLKHRLRHPDVEGLAAIRQVGEYEVPIARLPDLASRAKMPYEA
jgi:hypothetical protein